MTIPFERTRSLLFALDLMTDLSYGTIDLEEAQRRAKVTLRHYPDSWELRSMCSLETTCPSGIQYLDETAVSEWYDKKYPKPISSI